ncbi:MAG: M48 family metalloprotease [Lentimicrobiaceae bacterium]|nr:M48 family metalloprotease [Lentimicrobiaceae bacterium]
MKNLITFKSLFLVLILSVVTISCSKDSGGINIFSLQDDITFGNQVDQEILSKPQEYPLLDSTQYPTAYKHLYRIRNTILALGELKHANDFGWKCRIIKNDTVVNAFCVPGGNIYVYTGIIKLLDNEAQFAGVMAHEMAHADRRHSTKQLTYTYGIDILLSAVLGDSPSTIASVAAGLAEGLSSLAFSRDDEYEADEYAVKYLYKTEYDAASLGDFFSKMMGQSQVPVFLSTHPSDEKRLEKINEVFNGLGGVHKSTFPERYQEFKNSLP